MTELIWDTDDWNNAVSSTDMIVKDGNLFVSVVIDDFDSYSTGSFPPSPWVQNDDGTIVDGQSHSGSNSFHFSIDSLNGVAAYSEGFPTYPYDIFTYKYRETSSTQEFMVRVLNENDNEIMHCGSNNPQVEVTDNGSRTTIHNPTDEYQRWRKFTITFDWANNQFDADWEDLTGFEDDQNVTDFDFTNNSDSLKRVEMFGPDGDAFRDVWLDDITAITASTGNLITAGKTS